MHFRLTRASPDAVFMGTCHQDRQTSRCIAGQARPQCLARLRSAKRNTWPWLQSATQTDRHSSVESNVDGLIANGVIIEHMSTHGSDDTVNALRVLREAR